MKKQYALSLFLGAVLIVAIAAIAGSGRNAADLPAPPAVGTMISISLCRMLTVPHIRSRP
ncbi:MAG TPA: hypothetical protein VHP99_18480 [Pyrinomonadaceae bacterium]|jgi:hypothetical protein|nr:hypothetical protein [Pyrinomonadaceae bacterium]